MGSIPVRVIFCLLEVVRKLVGCAAVFDDNFVGGQRPERRKLRPNRHQSRLYDDLKNKNVNFALPLDCVNFFGGQRPGRKKKTATY